MMIVYAAIEKPNNDGMIEYIAPLIQELQNMSISFDIQVKTDAIKMKNMASQILILVIKSINILTTLKEYVISFAFVAAGGIALAILISWSKTIQNILMPAFIFICSLPMIAIAPILLIWIGYGLKTNVLVAFLVSFFPMVINTITGLGAQDRQLLDLVRYLGANRWQVLLKIQLPGALPYIFSGLKISSSLCIMGVIVGELIASDKGLGYVIVNAQLTMDTPPMFASLIMMSLLGWGMYLLVSLCERLLTPWNFVKERVDS